ncbi:MAG: mannitol dehydrogenase family protein [Lacisediminihabitans sp.]
MPESIASLREARHPVRIVHLGLGAFHRAHQAWYTQLANDLGTEAGWGIAAFTGRSPAAAEALHAQGEVYTLIERSAFGDTATVIESISEAMPGTDHARWRAHFADPAVAVVTLTITEVGYRLGQHGGLDLSDPEVAGDILRVGAGEPAVTAPGRLADGLRQRMLAGAGPIAIVSCDNLSDNGGATRAAVLGIAGGELAHWIEQNVSFVSTMVDRITPATTADDRAIAERLIGATDAVPVVTEPFSEWVLAGEFPAGRPAWDRVGARFVDDVAPFERRKLWLHNAAHSLLAYRGLLHGHSTVDEAMLDPDCADAVEQLWAEAREVLPFDDAELDRALEALRDRFGNPRIRHLLAQVAADGAKKLGPRIIDPVRARLAAGLSAGDAQLGVLAAWALHLTTDDRRDPLAGDLAESLGGLGSSERAEAVLAFLAPDLTELAGRLAEQIAQLTVSYQGAPPA